MLPLQSSCPADPSSSRDGEKGGCSVLAVTATLGLIHLGHSGWVQPSPEHYPADQNTKVMKECHITSSQGGTKLLLSPSLKEVHSLNQPPSSLHSLPLQRPCPSPAAISCSGCYGQDRYSNSLRSIFVQRENSCITQLQINLLSRIHADTQDPQEQHVPLGKSGTYFS